MTNTTHALRPGLTPRPLRIARLPISDRGYPVPWFVDWIDGVPDFRVTSFVKFADAIQNRRCWVCGDRLGQWLAFAIGPMCAITRTTTEPPSHYDCAAWSAINCPFLSRPNMVRRDDAYTETLKGNGAGIGIDRNPGVVALWVSKSYRTFNDHQGRTLIRVGDPERVEWWAHGRQATRAEVLDSIASGYPALYAACAREQGAQRQLAARGALAALRAEVERTIVPAEVAPR